MRFSEELRARGFVKTTTESLLGTPSIDELLDASKLTAYVGFDATADSLHVGSLMPIMAMAHLQRAGHRPIFLIGGWTTMIGDPSGKTELRKMLTQEAIASNGEKILAQLKHYVKFGEGDGVLVNNADWLMNLNYIEFLRDIGRYFKVNEMIASAAYKLRLEREEGLTFIEFNYQLLQGYDYLVLHDRFGCNLQLGGDDQWGNILAGVDLIRKVKQEKVHALTLPLLTTASGRKMGKTEAGAVWLDPAKTSPYDYYQFWINTADADVERFLKIFTVLPLERIETLCAVGGAALRGAKEALAYEATVLTHGTDEADRARTASQKLFGSGENSGGTEGVPQTSLTREQAGSMNLKELLVAIGFADSKTAADNLIKAGGISAGGDKISNPAEKVLDLAGGEPAVLIKKGKTYHQIVIEP